NLRALTAESAIIASHHDCTRVQDAYSLRCMPQVHGSAREALAFAHGVLERELASVTDNPVVLAEDRMVLSGGNFHGEPLGLVLDALAIRLRPLRGLAARSRTCARSSPSSCCSPRRPSIFAGRSCRGAGARRRARPCAPACPSSRAIAISRPISTWPSPPAPTVPCSPPWNRRWARSHE